MKRDTGINLRVCKIREVFCDGKNNQFAAMIGLSPQNASRICKGAKPAGKETQEKILRAFPRVSRAWLVLGEGEMLKPDHFAKIEDDANANTTINNNMLAKEIVSNQVADIDRLIALLENKDRQIDRLIALLEKQACHEQKLASITK